MSSNCPSLRQFRWSPVPAASALVIFATGCAATTTDADTKHWPDYEISTADGDATRWQGQLSVVVGTDGRHPNYADGSVVHLRLRQRNGDVWFDGPIPWDLHTLDFRLPPDDYELRFDEHACTGTCDDLAPAKTWCEGWVRVHARDRTDLYAEFAEDFRPCDLREYLRSVETPRDKASLVVEREYEDAEMTRAWRLAVTSRDTLVGNRLAFEYLMPASVRRVGLLIAPAHVQTPADLTVRTADLVTPDDPRLPCSPSLGSQCVAPVGAEVRACASIVDNAAINATRAARVHIVHRISEHGGCG